MFRKKTLDSSFVTFVRVVSALLEIQKRKNLRVLTIGDSHAASFHNYLTKVRPHNQNILCWLGPRLMFSVSKKGLGLSKVQKITLRVWKPQYCFVWLGEIDVRMHLVKHNNSGALDLSWLDELLTEFRMLFKTLGQPVMVVFSPVPQSEIKVIDSEFPAYGDFKSRIRVQDQFIRELEKSILLANFPIKFLEISSFLKDESGQLNPNFSEDNCHLNFEGFEAIKGLWAELDGPFLI